MLKEFLPVTMSAYPTEVRCLKSYCHYTVGNNINGILNSGVPILLNKVAELDSPLIALNIASDLASSFVNP